MRSGCEHCTRVATARELKVSGLQELIDQYYIRPDNLAIRYGMKFEDRLEQQLKQNLADLMAKPTDSSMEATLALMDEGVPVIYQGVLRGGTGAMVFSGRPDFLLRSDYRFEFGDEVELRDSHDSGSVVRCRQHDLSGTEIATHLAHNKQVTKIALIWQQRLQFVIEQDLAIKRFKPTDVLLEQQDKLLDATPEQRIDAYFALFSGEFSQLYPQLVSLFQTELSVD